VLPNHSKLRTLPIYLQQEMIGVNKMPKSPGGGWRAMKLTSISSEDGEGAFFLGKW